MTKLSEQEVAARDSEIVLAVQQHHAAKGYGPALRDLRVRNLPLSTIAVRVDTLVDRGYLARDGSRSRSLRATPSGVAFALAHVSVSKG